MLSRIVSRSLTTAALAHVHHAGERQSHHRAWLLPGAWAQRLTQPWRQLRHPQRQDGPARISLERARVRLTACAAVGWHISACLYRTWWSPACASTRIAP
jgi:hypothetical protein